jgi:hypothetical protein
LAWVSVIERPVPVTWAFGGGGDRMGVADHDPRRWGGSGTWADEPAADALARTPPFGRRFFAAVFAEFPALAAGATFLRWSAQPGDVYAVLGWPGGGAGVQIDPDLEYIIVSGAGGRAEYGDWGADQVPPAVDHIRSLVLGAGPDAEPGPATDWSCKAGPGR